jgi:hypothetical protein
VAGVNHLYANFLDQQVRVQQSGGNLYYCQQPQAGGTGERIRTPNFDGSILPSESQPADNPGPPSSVDGIAQIQTWLAGKVNLVIGTRFAGQHKNPKVYIIQNGKDMDANHHEPLVVAVWCEAKMFAEGPGGHVVIIAERRDGPQGKTSRSEYKLLNSWGFDRNGWVSADALASAMCYTDPQHDESVPPHRALEKDALPPPSPNQYARAGDFILGAPNPYDEGECLFNQFEFVSSAGRSGALGWNSQRFRKIIQE